MADPSPYPSPLRLGLNPRTSPAEAAASSTPGSVRSIRDLAGRTALWRQPSQLRQEYEMVIGEEVVATLRWRKNVGTNAVGRSPDGTWSFKAAGFLNPRVTLRLPNSDYDFAVFRPKNTGEGVLEAMADQRFTWRCVNFWQNAWAFFDPEGDRLMTIKPDATSPKLGAQVAIEHKASSHQEIGYLAILGWYLLVLMAEDAAAGQPGT
ncbi:MAG TPA: hypothetical protein VK178_10910 [Opitutaceae bacterium]|nr:hypothetical protein [Opitutaceae bacterium]